ncbi:hypothetical protein MPDQ_004818 [Monascus purpureus]|uniref:DUF1279 domain-containing protein n=1 Tax=Monascus purpureus TaxID=5098 RepID=A0A507QIX3_MONPU|nr:hypothetical protein MPDQ_004818 [Monascus purpureus]
MTHSIARKPFVFASTSRPPTSCSWTRAFSSGSATGRPARRSVLQENLKQPHTILRRGSSRQFNSSKAGGQSSSSSPEHSSLSQKLRKLSREYGWSALGVYLLLSAVDFPLCFLAVRFFGTEKIGHIEHVIVSSVKDAVGSVCFRVRPGESEPEDHGEAKDGEPPSVAVEKKNGEASIWTQVALAYAIHKSLIFIRVPLTAAVTPKVVQVLRNWGWNIGKRTPKT